MCNTDVMYFSAPGRTEICGNHTDHQHGCVIAAAVNLETTARVQLNGTDEIRIESEGYEPFSVKLGDYEIKSDEINTTAALVRGVASAFAARGAVLQGFNAQIQSSVLPGSGLSSSAAFEVLMGTILNHLFLDGALSAVEIAQIGQYAENVYFGKPSGLMDQAASSVGGLVYIDFADPKKPIVEKVAFDFARSGYALCIINSGADHADLTDEYTAIPAEMKAAAAVCGQEVLRDVEETLFFEKINEVRARAGDRAVLRAIHFFAENRRVGQMAAALRAGDMDAFLYIINESGESSWELLQNVTPAGAVEHQEIAVSLALAKSLLRGRGAVRVHGGGFAGTIQAFVPTELLDEFCKGMEAVLGEGHCHVLSVRPEGGIRVR